MTLKLKFFVLFGIVFIIILGIWHQSDKIILSGQNDKIRYDLSILLDRVVESFTGGNTYSVYDILARSGYRVVDRMPSNAVVLSDETSNILDVIKFRTPELQGFKIRYFDEVIAVKSVSLDFWEVNGVRIFLLIIILVLTILAFITRTLLEPLKSLSHAISNFSQFKDFYMETDRDDEIGILIKAFNDSASKITRMMKSRELILRNIGHELKTPLAKMKLALAMPFDDKTTQKLQNYVGQMQKVSENMLEFELINSGNIVIEHNDFYSETLLFESLKNFFDEEKFIHVDIEQNIILNGDLRLLSIALSNLVQNALKYSLDSNAYIQLRGDSVRVSNRGTPLSKDIGYYLEPFYRDEKHSAIQGYGLGLSIVSEILNLHNMKLGYEFKADSHIFSIIFCGNTKKPSGGRVPDAA